jgi:3-deoxy-manno-octulosonate cytidylyltransferase (CMP-KDO synthetase)
MKILGVIPSRFGSSRFPGKPLIDLAGKSMIQRVYEGAIKCNAFTKLVVATDDERIYAHVQDFGGEAIMTSSEHQSGTERCGEVIAQFPDFDVVVNIQGDEPLVDAEQLNQLLAAFENPEIQIATLGILIQSQQELFNPNRIKVVVNAFGQAIYFSRNPIPFGAQMLQEFWMKNYPYLRHIGLYAYRAETLSALVGLAPTALEKQESLEQLRWMYYGFPIHVVMTEIETPNIDSPEDVAQILDLLT